MASVVRAASSAAPRSAACAACGRSSSCATALSRLRRRRQPGLAPARRTAPRPSDGLRQLVVIDVCRDSRVFLCADAGLSLCLLPCRPPKISTVVRVITILLLCLLPNRYGISKVVKESKRYSFSVLHNPCHPLAVRLAEVDSAHSASACFIQRLIPCIDCPVCRP